MRPFIKEWNLQIRDVTWEDQGQYRCTVNTVPVKSKIVMLHVKGRTTVLLSNRDIFAFLFQKHSLISTLQKGGGGHKMFYPVLRGGGHKKFRPCDFPIL